MRKILSLLLVAVMAATFVPTVFAEDNSAKIPPTGLEEKVLKWREVNSDTVGWIKIPGTNINQPVMWYPDDRNHFYNRRDEYKRDSFNGCYYTDFRCDFSKYTMPAATTVYGHSITGKNGPKAIRFDELRNFKDAEFAKQNPYIYFSDGNRTYTFKIFAIYTENIEVPYNDPLITEATRKKLIDRAIANSIHDYGVKPSTDAKFLTLSTSTYNLADGTPISYPNNYRFVVMAYAIKNPNS